jgi:RNA polymerase sigma-70 factor, ECF subfamily
MRLKNDLDVEDCLNRVFEKLWLQGYEVAPAARRSWLFVVARNEAALVARIAARQSSERAGNEGLEKFGSGDSGGIDPASQALMPLESLLRKEQIDRLRIAARGLSDQQTEILRFRFVDDLTFREIAEQLQIPLGTALTRVRAAILKLKKTLDDEEYS